MKKERKKGSGGKRQGAGRPIKFKEESKYLQILVPVCEIVNIKKLINNYLKGKFY